MTMPRRASRVCPVCHGAGVRLAAGIREVRCLWCGGTGRVSPTRRGLLSGRQARHDVSHRVLAEIAERVAPQDRDVAAAMARREVRA